VAQVNGLIAVMFVLFGGRLLYCFQAHNMPYDLATTINDQVLLYYILYLSPELSFKKFPDRAYVKNTDALAFDGGMEVVAQWSQPLGSDR
jgi:hypothetical protein